MAEVVESWRTMTKAERSNVLAIVRRAGSQTKATKKKQKPATKRRK
jgi:predicted Fe-S protein YdhL (DUF1289 family)